MKTRLLLTIILVNLSIGAFSQKIVGYLPSYRDPSPTLIQYSKMTHVLYSFVNPNASGVLVGINTPNIGDANYDFNMNNFIVAKANCYPMVPNGPKLVISVGGADGGNVRANNLNNVSANAGTRATFISQLINFALAHNLDGIDIDWEFPVGATAKNNHQTLIADLRAAINACANPYLRLGVAVGGETTGGTNHTQYINAATLPYIDDFHLMAYDLPATYNANNHSALGNMAALINNWNTFGIPKSKMILGVPFYGRTPARSAVGGEYNVITASLTGTALTNAFNNDATSGFYYNGKTTLEAKVDLIITTNCGQGIMIWDVGQDRTDAYSLLTVIYNRINNTACTLPQPNLGPDVSFCGANTLLTASGTPAASGRSFVWKRNGVTAGTTSVNTYTATQGGTWTVTVSEGCCSRTDEIIVTQGASVTATGGNRCGAGVVTLNVTSTGATYDWYSANTGGTYLATGSAYTTPSISTTTTYYVQQNSGNTRYLTGKAYPGASPQNEFGDYSGRAHWANMTTVNQTITIKSVDMYYSGPAVSNVRLVAYASDGLTVAYQSTPVSLPAQSTSALAAGFPVTLNTNLTLPPGTYYLGLYAPGATVTAGNPGFTMDPGGVGTTYTEAGLFSINGQAHQNWGGGFAASVTPTTRYGQIFNWVILAGANPCGRTAVIATVNCPPTINLTSPAPPGPVSGSAGTPITLTSTASDDGSISTVVYEVRDALNNVIATVTGGAGPNYSASWTPPSNVQYRIRAVATDNVGASASTSDVIVNVILPVTLLYFDAEKQQESVVLNWATATEINNDHFTLERSADGITFEPIGIVQGSGNSSTILGYSYTDQHPLAGKSYYRLVQYDYDGTASYSEVKTVAYSTIVTVSPNPFEQSTKLVVSAESNFSVKISTLQGVLISEQEFKTKEESYEVGANLKPGIYLLNITTPEQSLVYKIEKIQ